MEVLFHIFCYTGLKKIVRYTKDVVIYRGSLHRGPLYFLNLFPGGKVTHRYK